MVGVASEFVVEDFSAQPASQITWFTLIEIIQRSKTHEEMLYYIN